MPQPTPSRPPIISIITPTYNRPGRLVNTIQQVRHQSPLPFPFDRREQPVYYHPAYAEHIVVSDGPDRFASRICSAFPPPPSTNTPLLYLSLPAHHGYYGSAARDLGLTHARGEYVAFWDDDNWFHPEYLSSMLAAIMSEDADAAVCKTRNWNGGKSRGPNIIPGNFPVDEKSFFYPAPCQIDTACVVLRTSFARQEKWFADSADSPSPTVNLDFHYFSRLWQRNPKVAFVNRVLAEHVRAEFG